MMRIRGRSLIAGLGLLIAAAVARTGVATVATVPAPRALAPRAAADWPIDRAHSRVTFAVTKWGFVEVEGRFLDFAGTIRYDAARPEASRVEWRVRVASVETGAVNRDRSLQGVDYFDAAHHPELRFISERVKPLSADQIEVQGTLTMRGRSRPLTIHVVCGGVHTVPGEGTFEIFQTAFTINRYDYGIEGGALLGPAISKDVRVKIVAATNHQ
jgi:polyisoprenoid-binding protein YceI